MDLYKGWKILAMALVLGTGLCLVYIMILRYCTKIIIWISIAGTILGLAALGFTFFLKYQAEEDEQFKKLYKVLMVVIWGVDALLALVILCLFNDIKSSLSIAESAGKFMTNNLSVVFVPFLMNIFAALFVVFWSYIGMYLLSTGEISQFGSTPFVFVDITEATLRNSFIYFIFAFLWLWIILMALNQFVIAATTIQWYFTENSDTKGKVSILKSFYWGIFCHIGSLAFGSLLLTLITIVRWIFDFMRRQILKAGQGSVILRCVLCCFGCCLKCIGECVLFLTKNAYVQVALRSTSFCCAARESFRLLVRNAAKFAVVNGFSAIFIFFGKCTIGAITALICFYMIDSDSELKGSQYAPTILTIASFLLGYVMAMIFLTVYELSSIAILQCFMIDEETSKGEGKNRPPTLEPLSYVVKDSLISMDNRN